MTAPDTELELPNDDLMLDLDRLHVLATSPAGVLPESRFRRLLEREVRALCATLEEHFEAEEEGYLAAVRERAPDLPAQMRKALSARSCASSLSQFVLSTPSPSRTARENASSTANPSPSGLATKRRQLLVPRSSAAIAPSPRPRAPRPPRRGRLPSARRLLGDGPFEFGTAILRGHRV